MKTMIDLFYETFNPRQKRHHLSMALKEKPGEHTIRILQNGREIIRATGDEREQAFQMATRDLPRGDILVSIARALDVSIDYLVGISNVKKRQTNADRIRNMSDEELAEFLAVHDLALNGNDLPMLTDWFEWLQSEAE